MFWTMLGTALRRKYLYWPGPGWLLVFSSKDGREGTSAGLGDWEGGDHRIKLMGNQMIYKICVDYIE